MFVRTLHPFVCGCKGTTKKTICQTFSQFFFIFPSFCLENHTPLLLLTAATPYSRVLHAQKLTYYYSFGSHSMGMFLKVISPLSSPHLATNFTMSCYSGFHPWALSSNSWSSRVKRMCPRLWLVMWPISFTSSMS